MDYLTNPEARRKTRKGKNTQPWRNAFSNPKYFSDSITGNIQPHYSFRMMILRKEKRLLQNQKIRTMGVWYA